ncbi:MAG: helix-turn-helix domain-containing protein [Lysobacterales bacterium]
MSTADSSMSEQAAVDGGLEAAQKLGKRLLEARTRRKLSERELARQINLTGYTISRIESGDWDQLGAPVYLRGYVYGLARILQVDCSAAETYFESRERAAENTRQSDFLVTPKPTAFDHSHRLMGYVAATALLAIPITWLVMGAFDGQIRSPAASNVASTSSAMQSSSDSAANSAEQGASTGRMEPRLASMSPLPELLKTPAVSPPAPVLPVPMLHLDFAEEAWLEVHDLKGKRLAYGLIAAGTRRSFDTGLGLSVRVGNADAVGAFLDDALFDLEPHSKAELAEFSLPAQ